MTSSWAFAEPLILLFWLLLPFYGVLRGRQLRRAAVPYAPLQYRGPRHTRRWHRWITTSELLLLGLLTVGLAGPHRLQELDLIEDPGIDVALVLDVSLSMLATDLQPNRLEALRHTARAFISRSGGHRLGLVIFANDVYVQSPFTTDQKVLLELLDHVSVYNLNQSKSGGTAIGDALLVAVEELDSVAIDGRDQALVLITDGESNNGIDPVLAARHAASQGIRVYAIGIGGEEPVRVSFEGRPVGGDQPYLAVLDDRQLRALTEAASGVFYRATDVGVLGDIFARLSRLESSPLEVRTVAVRHFYTHALAIIALAFFIAFLVLAGLVARRPLW